MYILLLYTIVILLLNCCIIVCGEITWIHTLENTESPHLTTWFIHIIYSVSPGRVTHSHSVSPVPAHPADIISKY